RAAAAPVDRVVGPAEAVPRAVTVERLEPGSGGELIETGRAGRAGPRARVERGFDLGLGEQVVEIDASRGRGAGNRRAHIASLNGTDFGHEFPRIAEFDPVSATSVPVEC